MIDLPKKLQLKKCNKCLLELELVNFCKNNSTKDRLSNTCKSCQKDIHKKYRETNRDNLKLKKSEYYQKNRKKILKKSKNYYNENKEQILTNSKEFSKARKERKKEYNKSYREKNKHRLNKYMEQYYLDNTEKIKEYQKEYNKNNKGKINSDRAFRKHLKKKATPPWLSPEQLLEIEHKYVICASFSQLTNVKYHVDHIHPIKGKNLCGLHVPWNLRIISAIENLKKHNKYIEESC